MFYEDEFELFPSTTGSYELSVVVANIDHEEYTNELATDSISIEFAFPGDFNLDGDVNIIDLVGSIQHIIYGIPASDLALAAADYNYDGDGNILDLVATIQFIVYEQP